MYLQEACSPAGVGIEICPAYLWKAFRLPFIRHREHWEKSSISANVSKNSGDSGLQRRICADLRTLRTGRVAESAAGYANIGYKHKARQSLAIY